MGRERENCNNNKLYLKIYFQGKKKYYTILSLAQSVRVMPRYFGAIVKDNIFLTSFSVCLPFVYRKAMDFVC